MTFVAIALLFLFQTAPVASAQSTPAKSPKPGHRSGAKAPAATKTPPAPKTAAEIQQDIETALQALPFGQDHIDVALQGNDITLSGAVHVAEHKGLATVAARQAAQKDGMNGYHVLNHLEVQLAGTGL